MPPEVAELTRRMLARRRENRPFDLNEIAQVLSRHTSVTVPPFGPPHIPGVQAPVDGPAPNAEETLRRLGGTADSQFGSIAEEPGPRRARMGRLTTIGLGVLVVSVLVGESFLLWRGHSRQPGVAAPAQALRPDAAIVHAKPAQLPRP